MNRIALVFAVALFTGCSQQPAAEAESIPAPDVASDAELSSASASGTIEAVDPAAGKLTISHGPVESLGWPSMTMDFKATPEQIASVRVGQVVAFDFVSTGMDGTITSIEVRE